MVYLHLSVTLMRFGPCARIAVMEQLWSSFGEVDEYSVEHHSTYDSKNIQEVLGLKPHYK